MPDIALRFNKDVIVVEGGMDAMLARMGIADEPCLPYLNVLAPDTIADIHRSYHLEHLRRDRSPAWRERP